MLQWLLAFGGGSDTKCVLVGSVLRSVSSGGEGIRSGYSDETYDRGSEYRSSKHDS